VGCLRLLHVIVRLSRPCILNLLTLSVEPAV